MNDNGKELDALIASVFKTASGKKLMEHLDERFIRQPVCNPGQTEGQGYFREWQNSVIRFFQSCIKRREKGDY